MLFAPSIFLTALAALPLVAAHGLVSSLEIDGQNFPGNLPLGPSNPSIIRQINDPSPVKGATNPSVNCGPGAPNAVYYAKANPGSKFAFKWTGADLSNWPHNTGPMLTYMASCGSTTCDKFDARTARWFKIQQVGRSSPGGNWAQQDLMNGAPAQVTLPANIAPGNYLIRHEIIALHLANTMGGAEFYPSCSQLTVTGTGTGVPKDSELVSLPGAYSDTDPGIYTQDAFNTDPSYVYPFPGPQIAAFVNEGPAPAGDSASNSTATPSATSSSPSSTGVSGATSSGSSGGCRLRKRAAAVNRPRHFSRIMRDLHLHHSGIH